MSDSPHSSRLKLFWAWYDLWIGAYYDRTERQLYVCLIPTCVLRVQL